MNIQNSPYLSALQMPVTPMGRSEELSRQTEKVSFDQVLMQKMQGQTGELKFSKHAANRLAERNIILSPQQLARLQEGTEKASGKGIKEPLVLIDDMAFIVSTGTKTVITAMGYQNAEENIFTNIDGAVIN